MSRYNKARAQLAAQADTYPFKAVSCTSVAPMSGHQIGRCVSAVTDRGCRTFIFCKEADRDQFVATIETAEIA
ncbi:hypothetical protein [Alterisphingorhabdus coralli]|uniref:Uncharacterized protein n=1 Tax=Alterisphingorhabdus coralli TaxID=3071408 RepID=A0AA97F9F5_9SPHN|nr:hypothetical protein [Parasphingorhabdus sp. SCSIO 66989]WOE76351.1 hypothetical protein RB602_06460 [Parasphingorhabdus sp. SCSIO 66989]